MHGEATLRGAGELEVVSALGGELGGWSTQRCWELEKGLGSVAAWEAVRGRVKQS